MIAYSVNGQNQNNQWHFGFNNAISFNTTPPSAVGGSAVFTREGSAVFSDPTTGDLLFYTNGVTVWDKNNDIMPNGDGLLGGVDAGISEGSRYSSTSAAVIVPRPFTPDIYYVITIDQTNSDKGLRYSVVDLSLNGGLGAVVAGQKNIFLRTTRSEKLQAVPKNDGCGYWLVSTDSNTNNFLAYSITSTGIDTTPVISPQLSSKNDDRGHIKINPQRTKIAVGNGTQGFPRDPKIELYDFNADTGVISNPIAWEYPIEIANVFQGVAFSPNGNKLYVSPAFSSIIQYDISSNNPATIAASFFEVTTGAVGTLQLGPDNKIYAAERNELLVINNPNNAGAACNFQSNPVPGLSSDIWYGLPQKVYILDELSITNDIVVTGDCVADEISFALSNTTNVQSVSWDFGDPASGAQNTSTSLTPKHTFSGPGNFTVTVEVTYPCDTITLTKEVTINPATTPTFSIANALCSGATAPVLPGTSDNGITGTWSPAIDNTATTTYTFTPDAGQCDSGPVSVTITIDNSITPSFSFATSYCAGSTIPALPTTSDNGITGTWSPAIDNIATTTYTFTPDAGQCDNGPVSVTITIDSSITPSFSFATSYCAGSTIPALPLTSDNGITGTWSPAIDNTTTTTYTFTPDGGQCDNGPVSVTITIDNSVTPIFTITDTYCAGSSIPALPTTSDNGITGIWSPAIDNTTTTTYTFTPDAGQCDSGPVSVTITIDNSVTPSFSFATSYCAGSSIPALPTTSDNGITGTWSPAIDNTATTTYTFTPAVGECATTTTQTITISPSVTPTFSITDTYCAGSTIPALPTTSDNGITGIWSPAIDNTATTTYTFTPDVGQCDNGPVSVTITIDNSVTPSFSLATSYCTGSSIPALPTTSDNGITGIWSPAIDNTATTTYTFTPDAGQCDSGPVFVTITIDNSVTPSFSFATSYCTGSSIPALPTTSDNGITGIWSPAIDNTTTTTYTFTPDIGQCDSGPISVTITIDNSITPSFSFATSYCTGSTIPALPTTSDNGITGTWFPAIVDSTIGDIYTFNPDPGQCAASFDLSITIALTTLQNDFEFDYSVIKTSFDRRIEIELPNQGSYSYQLNNGMLQDSPIFTSVEAGPNVISVYFNGPCSEALSKKDIFILEYPNFFTPNGDGVNDFWNISDLAFEPNAQIFIFDRYGKFLTQISPSNQGWDGTLNNRELPSSDYWFSTSYNRNGSQEELKGHFTLKR
ncbi:MAG: T9SS type B sorting domain-containing protein [Bacteroidota bacterium]